MSDFKRDLRQYIDSLEEPVSVQETMSQRTRDSRRRFRAPIAVLAGAAVVLVPALVLVALRVLPGDQDPTGATTPNPPSTSITTTTYADPPTEATAPAPDTPDTEPNPGTTGAVEITPAAVTASETLNEAFAASNLIDGDLDTTWQAPHDETLTIEFRWAEPVRISYIEIYNLADDDHFLRNFRIEGYSITVDDLTGVEYRNALEDLPGGPQRIEIASIQTRVLTIEVLSSYASQAVGDNPAFHELVLAELQFWGGGAES